jgi:hypothetical protein
VTQPPFGGYLGKGNSAGSYRLKHLLMCGGFGCVISVSNSTGTVWFEAVALTWNV